MTESEKKKFHKGYQRMIRVVILILVEVDIIVDINGFLLKHQIKARM